MSHKHEVYDTDKHYIINATTHIIKSDGFYAWMLHNNANQENLYISFNGCEFYGNYKNASIKLGYLGKNESICDVWLKNCMSDNGLLIKRESQSIASDDVYVIHNFTNIEQTKE